MPPVCRLKPALFVGSSDCPFLYHTKTILRRHAQTQPRRSICTTVSRAHSQPTGSSTGSGESSFLKQKAAEVEFNRSKLQSSITSAEEAAFDNLWKLLEKPAQLTQHTDTNSTKYTDTDYRRILQMFSPLPHVSCEGQTTVPIVDNDEHTQSKLSVDTGPNPIKFKDSRVFNSRLAPAIQPKLNREGAIAEIQSFLKDTPESGPDHSFSFSNPESTNDIHSVAINIVKDAADSLNTALTSSNPRADIAMWRVAESKIFPLINLLHPSPSSSFPLPSSKPPASSQKRPLTRSSQNSVAPDNSKRQSYPHPLISANIPIIPILSSTYPTLTLLLLRLYATHYPTSPYALALLPKIKSLGSTSYVLGAHTHFFNTLLLLYWRIYSDLQGMNDLMMEMDVNSVEFDIGTWEALGEIVRDRERDLSNDENEMSRPEKRGSAWWDSIDHNFYLQKVGVVWRELVREKLVEQGILTGEVMREGAVQQGEHPEYAVML